MLATTGSKTGSTTIELSIGCTVTETTGCEIATGSAASAYDPLTDGEGDGTPGQGVVRLRAEAYGPMGARRAVEAELVRHCLPAGQEGCQRRNRVQSWQEVRQWVP